MENPYLRKGNEDIGLTGKYRYLDREDFSWKGLKGFESGKHYDAWGNVPTDVGTYTYQGMDPTIMGALENVFGHGTSMTGMEDSLAEMLKFNMGKRGVDVRADSAQTTDYFDLADKYGWEWGKYGELGGSRRWEDAYEQHAQYKDLSLGADYEGGLLPLVNVFDPESIAIALSAMEGIDPKGPQAIRPGEGQALTPEMIKKTESTYYDPVVSAQRETLVDKLSKQASKAGTGGFAGSGARASEMSALDRLYRGGYEDILADIMGMRGQATQDVLDTMYGWAEVGSLS